MLFGYPIEATAENWLHECLIEMVITSHESIRNKQVPPAWPDIIPSAYRSALRRRTKLKRHLEDYQKAVAKLKRPELDQLSSVVLEQNQIENLLSGNSTCKKIDEFPEEIKNAAKALFVFAFELLTELEIRDHQYQVIFSKMKYHVCPFCGCEYFDAPKSPKEDLDHYLAKNSYPFAAANLLNLVPMGSKCNQKYKHAKDILFKDDGVTRRKSFFPYNHKGIQISLLNSSPFSGSQGIFSPSTWVIEFVPGCQEAETWDEVFSIRERYKRNFLELEDKKWLGEFASWCRSASVTVNSIDDVIKELENYATYMNTIGISDKAFLKAAFFKMLHSECQKGNQNLTGILSGIVFGVEALLGN